MTKIRVEAGESFVSMLCHCSRRLRFRGEIYQQNFGIAMGSPVSSIVVNVCMKDLEQIVIATAPEDCQPRSWKRYVDDVIFLVHTGKVEKLLQHMNTVDPTGSVVFTREYEKTTALLGCQVHQKGWRKREVHHVQEDDAHYLNFASYHPKHQKLGVVRTLMNRCETITTEEADEKGEVKLLRGALRVCGCPSWALKRSQTTQNRREKDQR